MMLKDDNYAQRGASAEQNFYRLLIESGCPQQVLRPESGFADGFKGPVA